MATKKNEKKKGDKTSEPKSMEALLEKYGEELKVFSRGDRVKGKVIEKRKDALVLDIGGKSEGIVAEDAFNEARGFIENLEIGDEVEAKVIVPESPEGYTILSLRQAASRAAWSKLQKAKKEGKPLKVEGKSINPSGVMVQVDRLLGFIPNSQLGKEATKNKEKLVGKNFKATVIEIDPNSNRLVLSEKAVSEGAKLELVKKALDKIKEGEVFEGEVTTISSFGCFVEIQAPVNKKKVPIEGLVHISELSWEKVDKTEDVVSVGDKVKVKVIGVKDGKLALSMKQAQKDPWKEAEKKYKADTKVSGKVVKTSDFGVFVELEPGVEGLIHITKIPPDKKLKEGDKIDAYVEEVDKKERKISLRPMLTAKPVGYK